MEFVLHLLSNPTFCSATSSSGLISVLDRNAASATVALVSQSHYHQPLVNRLTSTNVSIVLFGPNVRSPRTFHPAYHEFRELATWFRACGSHYRRAFQDILRSSEERFNAQHYCCDYAQEEEDFYFAEGNNDTGSSSSSSSSTNAGVKTSYFGPHLPPEKTENQICVLKSTTVTAAAALNASRPCGKGGGREGGKFYSSFSSPLPPPSMDEASTRRWASKCQHFLANPLLCRRRLTKTPAGVVQDGVLSVPAFAGLSCRTNRTFGFRYVVKSDFPELTRHFGLLDDDLEGESSMVILDNESEEAFVLRRVEKAKDMGEFVANFSKRTLTPYRRSGAADADNDPAKRNSYKRCLRKRQVVSYSIHSSQTVTTNSSLSSTSSSSSSSSPSSSSPPSSSTSASNETNSCIHELSSESLGSLLRKVNADDAAEEVLLFFYAKTCGLCKTFNRYFLRLSRLFREDDDGRDGNAKAGFRLARIDVEENDLPINMTVTSVPTIIFFRGVNYSRVFRPADDNTQQQQLQHQQQPSSEKQSRPRLSLSDVLSFVLRHVKNEAVRRKLASKLCDAACLKNNLEAVRKSSAELRLAKDGVVDAMLVINQRVAEAEREMLFHVDR